MKRGLVLAALAAAAAAIIWRNRQDLQAQRELWVEVTDPLP